MMRVFLSSAEAEAQARSARRAKAVLIALGALTAAAFAVLCAVMHAQRSDRLFPLLVLSAGSLGCAGLLVFALWYRPCRNQARHLEGLLQIPPEEAEGVFSLQDGLFQIPGSARVRRVLLSPLIPSTLREEHAEALGAGTGDDGPRSLHLDEDWVRYAPPDGTPVRLRLARRFITGIEVLRENGEGAFAGSTSPDDSAASAAGEAPARHARARRAAHPRLRQLAGVLPLLVLWIFAVVMFGGFITSRVTEIAPAEKITLHVDGGLPEGDALSRRLSAALPQGLRRVEVRPFTYFMFDTPALQAGDLFLLPQADAERYADWLGPLPEALEEMVPEKAAAVTVAVAAAEEAAADETTSRVLRCLRLDTLPQELQGLQPAETAGANPGPWLLFFGASSPHAGEEAVLQVALQLLE